MIEYSIDEQRGLIRARISGSNSCADLEKHIAAVYQDPRYSTSLSTLFEVDEDVSGPILTELPQVKQLLEITVQAPAILRKWAVVIPSAFKRMMVEFLLKDMRLKPLEMRLFADERAALAWLNDQ